MPDFRKRSYQEELMDDLDSGGDQIIQTLNEIDFINHWLGGNAVTTSGIGKLISRHRNTLPETVKIIDMGCGDGKMLILIAKWFRKHSIPVSLKGIDANPHIIAYAETVTKEYPEISVETGNIFDDKWRNYSCDIVTSTLFTHHFTDEELFQLFEDWFNMSKLGLVINDLHRHWFAYYSIKFLTQLFSKSKMVKFDAPLSVLRGFHRKELKNLVPENLSKQLRLSWKWAFRWEFILNH